MEEENIYISTKSACSTSDLSSSVYSIYKDNNIATHSIRISLSCKNTIEEVNKFNEIFDKVINKLLLKWCLKYIISVHNIDEVRSVW